MTEPVDSFKDDWEVEKQELFSNHLLTHGWQHCGCSGEHLYQMGGFRVLIDCHGVFIFQNINDFWVRIAGLSNDLIPVNHKPTVRIGPFGVMLVGPLAQDQNSKEKGQIEGKWFDLAGAYFVSRSGRIPVEV